MVAGTEVRLGKLHQTHSLWIRVHWDIFITWLAACLTVTAVHWKIATHCNDLPAVTWLTNCLASCLFALLQMVDLVVKSTELQFSFQMEWGSTSLAKGSARKCRVADANLPVATDTVCPMTQLAQWAALCYISDIHGKVASQYNAHVTMVSWRNIMTQ